MTRTLALSLLAAALLTSPTVQAADILEACSADIAQRCTDVEPGHGRIMACLYAHEDKVTDSCDAAMADTADFIDLMFDRLHTIKTQCGDDIRTYCQSVEIGHGRILSCLAKQQSSLSESCGALVSGMNLPSE
ncbi:MAG: cysteine rich repeat-containing protein [Pseudomonadota bacterium]